ncbi:MAG: endolytic transglycosylase MltG [Gammaproteobacteria bacterium]
MLTRLVRILVKIALGVLLIAAVAVYFDFRRFLDAPFPVSAEGASVVVTAGDSIATIARDLKQRGLLRSELYLEGYARASGQAARIQAGEYAITPEMTPRRLLANLVAGRVIQYSLRIFEGWTFHQMLAAIHGNAKLKPTLAALSDGDIMARLGHPGEHPEGRFFPDTYRFPAGTTDLDFLRRAYATMEQHLAEVWAKRAPNLPLKSPYEALILASIIEKETGLARERPAIAGVFVRRLQKDMRLQADPAVIYGMGAAFDGDIRRRDLEADTPYNTYTRKGLPPTPIALPGLGSLFAAVAPSTGEALYFVARGDGGHVFSRTLDEHNQAVKQYMLNRR